MAKLLDGIIEESDEAPQVELTECEERLLDAIEEADDPIGTIFEARADRAFTMQELSRRVFDPFPARVRLAVPGSVVEAVGFEACEGGWCAARKSLWDAFAALDGRFLSHDPLIAKVQHLMSAKDDDVLSLDAFIGNGRLRSSVPPASEVHDALLDQLAPLPEYRLSWRSQGTAGR